MKILIDRVFKSAKLDCTGGMLGATTSAGQVMKSLAKDHAKAIAGWDFSFYPEEGNNPYIEFTDAFEINSYGWSGAALEIATLLLNIPNCGRCGQELP